MNVLIVDDSKIMRSMIVKTLLLSGLPLAEIHQAGNGKEGLEELDRSKIDLVLTDINMPVLSGIDMVRKLRANAQMQKLPVVVISSEGSETRIDSLAQLGARFLHKPFTPESLREVVLELTGGNHD